MNKPELARLIGAGVLLSPLLAIGLPGPALAADAPPKPIVLYRADDTATDALRWSTSTGEQKVLKVVGDDQERWLVFTASDSSETRLGGPRIHPYWGDEFELRDEETGWWIRYSRSTSDFPPPELTAEMSLHERLERIRQAREEAGAETRGEIWTSDGILVQLSTREGPVLYSEVAPVLREKGLREGMPRATQKAARWLVDLRQRGQVSDREWMSEFDFLGLLVDALDQPADGDGDPPR